MNAWLTWKARLEHLINGGNECLCQVCCKTREHLEAQIRNRARGPAEVSAIGQNPWRPNLND